MVRQAMEYIDQTPDLETKIELIKTLNSVSAGKVNIFSCHSSLKASSVLFFHPFCIVSKILNLGITWQIYVEIERARLIKKLAKIKEEQGLIAEAADLMQEIAVTDAIYLFTEIFYFNQCKHALGIICHRN